MTARAPFRTAPSVRALAWLSIILCGGLARLAPAQETACRVIDGDRILARDLSAVLPLLRAVPPETVLATAPLPGSRRILHSPEILALAHRYSISLPSAPDVCFEWAMGRLDRDRVLEAMRASLNEPSAQIEIADLSTTPVPPGKIEFTREHLTPPAAAAQHAPVLWRGDVVYGDNRRFAIWARVRIAVPCIKAFAADSLRPGHLIQSSQLRLQPGECFPDASGNALTPEQFVGMVPLRSLAKGDEVRSDLVAPPNEVNRGEMVEIEVHSGAARLAFIGRAESNGRRGDLIAVRNPDSKALFHARVTGKDKAIVQAGLDTVDE